MKKLLVLLLVAIFVVTLTACGKDNAGEYSADDGNVSDNQSSGNLISDITGSDDKTNNSDNGNNSSGNGNSSAGMGSDNKNSDNNNSDKQNSNDQGSQNSMPSGSGNVSISKDEALDIALEQAGVSKENAKNIEIELDNDRNTPVWEIDFDYGQTEYSYDINAANGKIVDAERDLDF